MDNLYVNNAGVGLLLKGIADIYAAKKGACPTCGACDGYDVLQGNGVDGGCYCPTCGVFHPQGHIVSGVVGNGPITTVVDYLYFS